MQHVDGERFVRPTFPAALTERQQEQLDAKMQRLRAGGHAVEVEWPPYVSTVPRLARIGGFVRVALRVDGTRRRFYHWEGRWKNA